MADSYYEPGARRAERVADLFAHIAPRYDRINDLQSFGLHRVWKRRLIDMARVQPADRALDVCCGTGDIARALAQRGARVVGLDFSTPMLTVARARQEELREKQRAADRNGSDGKTPNPHFVRGDAQRIPFPDATFDIITVGYGLRNLTNWEIGIAEMQRVARPGGRLLALDFGKPDNAAWRAVYFAYLRMFVPLLGRVVCGDAAAYAYILESLHHFPAQQGIAAQMQKIGLANVRTVNLLGGVMAINYGEAARDSRQ
jgi:demethylmenaquinone methyltransferase / 2-methoxy-6-polyprenyl-1,4-benzoquinol methylase